MLQSTYLPRPGWLVLEKRQLYNVEPALLPYPPRAQPKLKLPSSAEEVDRVFFICNNYLVRTRPTDTIRTSLPYNSQGGMYFLRRVKRILVKRVAWCSCCQIAAVSAQIQIYSVFSTYVHIFNICIFSSCTCTSRLERRDSVANNVTNITHIHVLSISNLTMGYADGRQALLSWTER